MSRQSFSRRALGRTVAGGALALAGLGGARQVRAAGLPQPAERPILTITGRIGTTNVGASAVFDRPMLEALGIAGFETSTPWYKSPVRFDGVRMDRLMTAVGARGERVVAYALNDYSTEIPIDDFARYGTILALKRDGEYMTVRDKGPLFIVYPFDSDAALRHQRFYSRSAWQVARLVVA
jgi:hypothetical protein